MWRREDFVACPSCACHVRPSEIECPHCGERVQRTGGAVQRTAAALLLGLTTAVSSTIAAGCAVYGIATAGGPGGAAGSGGTGGADTCSSSGGSGGTGGAGCTGTTTTTTTK